MLRSQRASEFKDGRRWRQPRTTDLGEKERLKIKNNVKKERKNTNWL